jgi:hypothetical protein
MPSPATSTVYFPDGLQPSPTPFRVTKKVGAGTTVEIGGFTKIPNQLFGSGMARALRPSATVLYAALCESANRNSSNTFKASDKALASETTLSTRTICNARKKLIEKGLITVDERKKGSSYFYTLSALPLKRLPVDDRRPRGKLKPRGYHAVTIPGSDTGGL